MPATSTYRKHKKSGIRDSNAFPKISKNFWGIRCLRLDLPNILQYFGRIRGSNNGPKNSWKKVQEFLGKDGFFPTTARKNLISELKPKYPNVFRADHLSSDQKVEVRRYDI